MQIFSQDSVEFVYDPEGEQVFFFTPTLTYFSKLISSNFPPFEKIIPLEFQTKIELDRAEFIKNLNKAAVFARFSNNIVKLEIQNENLKFTANSAAEGAFESKQEFLTHTGEKHQISFNIRYLLDFLTLQDSDSITLGLNGSDRPIMLTTPTDDTWQYVVMPFKPKN